jgi:hypothetical protein
VKKEEKKSAETATTTTTGDNQHMHSSKPKLVPKSWAPRPTEQMKVIKPQIPAFANGMPINMSNQHSRSGTLGINHILQMARLEAGEKPLTPASAIS